MIHFISGVGNLLETLEPTIDDIIEWCKDREWISIDTETSGQSPHLNKVIMLQIGDFDTQFCIDTRYVEVDKLKSIFEDSSIIKIIQNAKFDLNHLRASFGWVCENVYCTLLAECIIYAGIDEHGKSLKDIVNRYCEVNLPKEEQGKFHLHGDKPFREAQITYAANDVKYLGVVREKQLELIKKYNLEKVLELELDVLHCFAEMEWYGVELDAKKWKEICLDVDKAKAEAVKKLDNIILNDPKTSRVIPKTLSLFDSEETTEINYESNPKCLYLLRTLGLKVEDTSFRTLEKNKNKHKFVEALIEYRKIAILDKSFGEKFINYINKKTGRIHASYWQYLDTPRCSCNDPNLQNIPSQTDIGKQMRKCFISKWGYSFVISDYSGQELRIIAEGSQDQVWLEAFRNGRDLHSEVASMMFGVDISKVKDRPDFLRGESYRYAAKKINFGLSYGMTAFKLSDMLSISKEEAQKLIDSYNLKFPKIKVFLSRLAYIGTSYLKSLTYAPFNSVRWYPKLDKARQSGDSQQFMIAKGEVERESKNHPIQGTGANMIKLAMVYIKQMIKVKGYDARLVMQIHDELVYEVKDEQAKDFKKDMSVCMEDAGAIIVKSIKMEVEAKISKVWEKD